MKTQNSSPQHPPVDGSLRHAILMRDKLIGHIIYIANVVYADDREMLSDIHHICSKLQTSGELDCNFYKGAYGYLAWAAMHEQSPNAILNTLIHDAAGFMRKEPGFSPRSYSYLNYYLCVQANSFPN